MKRSIAILAVAVALLSFTIPALKGTNAAELKWYDFNEGYKLAKKSKKLVLIDAYTDWCGWCKKMDRDTYSDATIIEKINKNFVPVKFNPELPGTYDVDGKSYSGPQLFMLMTNNQRTGYPTTFFINQGKNLIYAEAGYMAPDAFGKVLDNMVAAAK